MEPIKIQIFGRILLSSNTGELNEETIHSKKLMRLLVYLIMNRNITLTKEMLIDTFFAENSRKPEGALKNMIYRLRNSLKLLGKKEYICTAQGSYGWNPEIPVETDYEYFEKLMELSESIDTGEKKKLYIEALNSYRGNISGRLADVPWIMSKRMLYRSFYVEAVKGLCQIYEAEENWKDLELISRQGLTEDSLDEDIHCFLLRSLYKQNKYDLAMEHYEKANKMFYEALGIWRPEKLSAVVCKMMSWKGRRITSLSELMRSIQEPEKPDGVFFCDTQTFLQIYQMESQRIVRTGMKEQVMFLGIRRSNYIEKDSPFDAKLEEITAILEKTIHDNLRSGDVASKFGPAQFAVMLPACSYEESIAVAKRIQKKIWESKKMKNVELMYEIADLAGHDYG